ncbi:hypothetical protein IH992_19930 [Candidatus Poribacteria bacterium]|nr:hypothetical protein [Candidatus Poribacteria bacterium]
MPVNYRYRLIWEGVINRPLGEDRWTAEGRRHGAGVNRVRLTKGGHAHCVLPSPATRGQALPPIHRGEVPNSLIQPVREGLPITKVAQTLRVVGRTQRI